MGRAPFAETDVEVFARESRAVHEEVFGSFLILGIFVEPQSKIGLAECFATFEVSNVPQYFRVFFAEYAGDVP